MKRCLILISCLFLTVTASFSQDYVLLANQYKLMEGDTLTYNLYQGKGLQTENLEPAQAAKPTNLLCVTGGKKLDSIPGSEFSVINLTAGKSGQNYFAFEFVGEPLELPYSDLSKLVIAKAGAADEEDAVDDESNSVGTEYIAEPHYSLKALTCTDKNGGKFHSEHQNQPLEITLSQSPYKLLYGDDIIGHVSFKDKPIAGILVTVYVKSSGDNVYTQEYRTDEEGKFYFKLNRSGTWLIQTAYAIPSETTGSDFDYWQSAYSFGF